MIHRFRSVPASIVLALVLAGAATAGQAAAVSIQKVDLSRPPEIHVYFTVTDASGNAVLGLTDREVSVLCDGTAQTVASLQSVLEGGEVLAAALLFDRSGSVKKALDPTKEAAAGFIRRLSLGDRIAVISFDDRVRVDTPFTEDKAAAEAALRRIGIGQDTALYDAIDAALVALKDEASRRQAIVILSDGLDTKSLRKKAEVIGEAKARGIPLFAIGMGETIDREGLSAMAAETGGRFFEAPRPEDLLALYQKIGEQLQNQYHLTFQPTFGQDEQWHTLDVRTGEAFPAAAPPRPFIASSGPGISAETMGRFGRRLQERALILRGGVGAAFGFLLGFLILLLVKALRRDLRLGIAAVTAVLFLTVLLGGLVGLILQTLR
jgi:VWFA-related protein